MLDYHRPVLLDETMELLEPRPGGTYLDATLGGGGHTSRILELSSPDGVVIALDRDPEAIAYARERLAVYGDRLRTVQANFGDVNSVLESLGVGELDGALFDFGVSSHQLDSERGFSFMRDETLDMRMSPAEDTPSAADVVNGYGEGDLAEIIYRYGEERYSRQIARAIVKRRGESPIRTTGELADVILSAVGSRYRGQDIHPATRTFQAIRIEVNRELEAIELGVAGAVDLLRECGRVCCISFHSLEDRIVKQLFRRLSGHCECPPRLPGCVCGAKEVLRILTKKPVTPTPEEVRENPRSRSSRLRAAEKAVGPAFSSDQG